MNLYVVAEGVETAEQVTTLKNMDCNYVQGFYYAKPMPVKDITAIVMGEDLSPMSGVDEEKDNTIVNVKSKGHDKTMLVVDDLAMNRMILTEYFKDYFNVIEVPNGKVALDYIRNGGLADVIMLDLYMPIMDGFEFLEEINQLPDKKEIPIIVTSQADERGRVQAMNMGANHYLEKPYSVDMAFRCINEVMEESLVIGQGFVNVKDHK